MAKRIVWSEKKIVELEKQGYGQGHGAAYKPWLEVTDFSSHGRSRRLWSNKTRRVHHLFSDVEHDIFLAAEWSRSVIDIREQFPLSRDVTQSIAQELKIRHPCYPTTHVPAVMTVDFVLTISDPKGEKYLAINAKRDEEAENETSLEKIEIQRTYFERMGCEHHLIYHGRLHKQKIKNIFYCRTAMLAHGEVEPHTGFYFDLSTRMSDELRHESYDHLTLVQYCESFDRRVGLEVGTGLRVARMLMCERALVAKLDSPDLPNELISAFFMTSKPGRLRLVEEQKNAL